MSSSYKKYSMGNKDLQDISKIAKIIGGKWTLSIINSLLVGTKRFGQLQKEIRDINPRTLSKRLHDLEKQGYIKRRAYATVPPKVEYSLTEKGNVFKLVVNAVKSCDRKLN